MPDLELSMGNTHFPFAFYEAVIVDIVQCISLLDVCNLVWSKIKILNRNSGSHFQCERNLSDSDFDVTFVIL